MTIVTICLKQLAGSVGSIPQPLTALTALTSELKRLPCQQLSNDAKVHVMENQKEAEVSAKDRSPRRRQPQLDGTSAQMEKLIFGADDASASDFLKDLISSAGLRDAWSEMSKKFRSVQTQHAHLMSLASREALNRDYVTRPEFRGIVQEEYKQVLQDHAKRLAMVETQVQEEKQARVKLHKDVIELAAHIEEELNITQPQVAAAHKWLQSLDERCQGQHDKVLQALKAQEEDLNLREDKLHQEAKVISKSLDGEILERKVLGVEVRKQKEFLNGDAFQRHIEDTCNKALESYVRKEVMLLEVQRSSEEMCAPLRKLIEQLKKELKQLAEDCKAKDGYIHQCLENAETRLQNKDENLSDRINAVMDELPEKATVVAVDDVRGRLLYHVDLLEGFHMRLQKETTHKVEEVVTRLSEFQVILQDHEHALQHAAEEILHRGTKYDIAVLTDRVDKCALKDKMEGDLKEVREQLSWQSTKIESMQFQNGLSLQRSSTRRLGHSGMKSRNLSRSSSIASDAMGMGKTLSMKLTMTQASDMSVKFDDADSKAEDGSSSPSKKAQLDRQGSGHAMSLLLETDDAKDEAEEVQADPLDLLTGGGPELQDHLIEQQEQLQMLQEQLAEIQQASFMSGSTLTEVVQQQLEFLAQGVYCLGRVALRPRRANWQEQCTNLLSHLHAVMHWIIHRQRPAEWDPSALTTIALANASGEESAHSPPTVTRQDSQLEKGRSSLRRAKAASASQPKPTPERSNSPDDFFTRRQFAMGGPGWQQRSIPANGTYDDKRPKTSGAVLGSLHVSGGNAADGKRILVATPGVADVANSEQVKAEDAVSLPPLTGEPLSARGFKGKI